MRGRRWRGWLGGCYLCLELTKQELETPSMSSVSQDTLYGKGCGGGWNHSIVMFISRGIMVQEVLTQHPFSDGPHLQTAVLCEKVLVEQDGVKSAIRIFDRQTRTATGPTPPMEMESFVMEAFLLLQFKSGSARGTYQLQVSLQKPSGESIQPVNSAINFEGEDDRGTDIVANLALSLDMTGLYWFDIYLNGTRVTRVPMRVVYLPQVVNQIGP